MSSVTVDFKSYNDSITLALDNIGAKEVIAKQSSVLIKPNLVNASAHPVTTSVDCCEAVIKYVSSCSKADIIIAEGCGDTSLETDDVFDLLGYRDLSRHYGVSLVDLNESHLNKLVNKDCPVFPDIYLPEIAFTHFIISLPVLKAHSLSVITGTLKNMIGFAPPKYYSGRYGNWKKSVFHEDIHQSIIDLNRYRSPDLSIMDASVGLVEYHLGGRLCSPPVKKIIVGFNPVEVDRKAAALLKLNWKEIQHLSSPFKS
jgi:uncharacterized protein (DUF362 family)